MGGLAGPRTSPVGSEALFDIVNVLTMVLWGGLTAAEQLSDGNFRQSAHRDHTLALGSLVTFTAVDLMPTWRGAEHGKEEKRGEGMR